MAKPYKQPVIIPANLPQYFVSGETQLNLDHRGVIEACGL
jgi:hypothetical protein